MQARAGIRRLAGALMPIEVVGIAGLAGAILLAAIAGLSFAVPSAAAAEFIFDHYVGGATMAALLALLVATVRRGRPDPRSVPRMLRMLIALTLVLWVHFNLKLWSGLVNPLRFDEAYHSLDLRLGQLLEAMRFIAVVMSTLLGFLAHPYHDIFVAMFVAGFAVVAFKGGTELENLTTAVSVVLIVGGFSYSFAPAMGPFILDMASSLQANMMHFYRLYLESNGDPVLGGRSFAAGVAAMPSLHAAHATVLSYYAGRAYRASLYLFVPALVYICTEAVTNGFHYLVDIPAGLLIAYVSVLITRKLSRTGDGPPPVSADSGQTLRQAGR